MTESKIISYAGLEVRGPIKVVSDGTTRDVSILDSNNKLPISNMYIDGTLTSTDNPVSGKAIKAVTDNIAADKQDKLTETQLSAVNSGITSSKVSTYDSHLTNTSNPHSVTGIQVGFGVTTVSITESD